MLPAILLVGAGNPRRVWIPLPLVLLWPFWFLGWVVWLPVAITGVRWARPLRLALLAMTHLSGIRVDIDTKTGEHVHLKTY